MESFYNSALTMAISVKINLNVNSTCHGPIYAKKRHDLPASRATFSDKRWRGISIDV